MSISFIFLLQKLILLGQVLALSYAMKEINAIPDDERKQLEEQTLNGKVCRSTLKEEEDDDIFNIEFGVNMTF